MYRGVSISRYPSLFEWCLAHTKRRQNIRSGNGAVDSGAEARIGTLSEVIGWTGLRSPWCWALARLSNGGKRSAIPSKC